MAFKITLEGAETGSAYYSDKRAVDLCKNRNGANCRRTGKTCESGQCGSLTIFDDPKNYDARIYELTTHLSLHQDKFGLES